MNKKIVTKEQLDDIRSMAIRNFVDFNKGDLNDHQFHARCWLAACCSVMGVTGLEYPIRSVPEPVEE